MSVLNVSIIYVIIMIIIIIIIYVCSRIVMPQNLTTSHLKIFSWSKNSNGYCCDCGYYFYIAITIVDMIVGLIKEFCKDTRHLMWAIDLVEYTYCHTVYGLFLSLKKFTTNGIDWPVATLSLNL